MNSLSKRVNPIGLLLILFICIGSSYAEDKPNIQFENFWIVSPPEVARSAAGYGVIKNTGNVADTLIHICTESASVMLHKTEIKSGMAKMIHLKNIVIESNSELVLEPMSFHLMFMDLSEDFFKENAEITLYLEFEKSGRFKVKLPVRSSWD
jgi:copper(I)-binding protein